MTASGPVPTSATAGSPIHTSPIQTSPIQIGIDVGGTFTDAVCTIGGRTVRAKAPTTADDVSRGVLDACRLVAERAGHTIESLLPLVERFGLGTTAATNALASRAGRAVGLITTAGFEDAMPFAKGRAGVDAEGFLTEPWRLVARPDVVGVDERIDRHGGVIKPLPIDEVVTAGRLLVDEREAETLVVSFLWAHVNPTHEEQAVARLRETFPRVTVWSAAALLPVTREYERTSFAILNAYVAGALQGVEQLSHQLTELGLRVPMLLVHSAGGSISVPEARRVPLTLAMSGPAAGVAAAVSLAQIRGIDELTTCDMGGTSFDVAIVHHGRAMSRTRGDLMGVWTALPLVDVNSIGAGGGSIAWRDARGMLRVGPQSAGARPGPACYGRGGTQPTVTDALVVLGYLDPTRFLGGDMALDRDAAHEACASLGHALDLDAEQTAWGIRTLALEGMVRAVRQMIAGRGLDPRAQTLLSYGGCGGLVPPEIAAAIGAASVFVPELASVFSAYGAATTDIRRERLRSVTYTLPMTDDEIELGLAKVLRELHDAVIDDLAADGVPTERRSVRFEADTRFRRQVWELATPLVATVGGDRVVTRATLDALARDFRDEYGRRYGAGSMTLGVPIELVTIRAVGTGRLTDAVASDLPAVSLSAVDEHVPSPTGRRAVRRDRDVAGVIDVDVYDGAQLRAGHVIRGPALVDGVDTTIWLPAATAGRVDELGNLILHFEVPGGRR